MPRMLQMQPPGPTAVGLARARPHNTPRASMLARGGGRVAAIASPQRESTSSDSDAETPGFANQLEALRSMSVVVADTGDLAHIARFRPQDCTTNPSLVLKALSAPGARHFMDAALADARAAKTVFAAERPYTDVADRLEVALGAAILRLVPGRVSSEVDAHLSHDAAATYDKALRLLELYAARGVEPGRVHIKLASTWEGIRACERLQREGVSCNMTLLFSLMQAAACADAGAALISPFVGRIRDWHMARSGCEFAPDEVRCKDPGVQSVRAIYAYLRRHAYDTIVMAASFRNVGEIRELAGCDYITISPPLLAELQACTEPLPRKLHPSAALQCSEPRLVLAGDARGRHEFQARLGTDEAASELLAAGIDAFALDQRRLEAVIASLAE